MRGLWQHGKEKSVNAYEKGRAEGFAARLVYITTPWKGFQQLGQPLAHRLYKTVAKRDEFMRGWMENWRDPSTIKPSDEGEILTY